MADQTFSENKKDLITGARKDFNRSLRRLGDYLVDGTWVQTNRAVTFIDQDGLLNVTDPTGKLKFKRLSNGNLKAVETINHATDNVTIKNAFVVSLNPDTNTFLAAGLSPAVRDWTCVGSVDTKNGQLYWQDFGTGSLSHSDDIVVRSINFVDIC